jgi:hypothetical protein
LLDDLGDRRGYCHLKEEALDRIKWRNRLEEAVDLSSDRLLMMMIYRNRTTVTSHVHNSPTCLHQNFKLR